MLQFRLINIAKLRLELILKQDNTLMDKVIMFMKGKSIK
jgi:hypothetical protein